MWSQRFLEQRRYINRSLLRRITVMVDQIFGRLHQMFILEKMKKIRIVTEKNKYGFESELTDLITNLIL